MNDQDPVALVRRAVQRLARRLRRERPHDGLSATKLSLLAQLMDQGPLTSGELARLLRTTPQALTRSIEALVEDELVRRTRSTVDKRQQMLTITDAGFEALGRDAEPRDAFLGRAMADLLTPAERQLLVVAAGLMFRLADHVPAGR
ncbi:MAG: MarR family transcriptional regulator [Pseudonocardia sp.]|nr:MarR family transcriptional regulator [Pseudonocardia sp.]